MSMRGRYHFPYRYGYLQEDWRPNELPSARTGRVSCLSLLLAVFFLPLLTTPAFCNKSIVTPPFAILDVGAAAGGNSSRVELLSLRRVFATLGIPADILTDSERVSDYKVVFTAGELYNQNVSVHLSNSIYDFVESGGVVMAAGKIESAVAPLFGVAKQVSSPRRYRLKFVTTDPSTSFMDDPNEKTISLGNGAKHYFDDVIWSHGAILAERPRWVRLKMALSDSPSTCMAGVRPIYSE
jgi:hypothetical protein